MKPDDATRFLDLERERNDISYRTKEQLTREEFLKVLDRERLSLRREILNEEGKK